MQNAANTADVNRSVADETMNSEGKVVTVVKHHVIKT